jgi:hypothetical protein
MLLPSLRWQERKLPLLLPLLLPLPLVLLFLMDSRNPFVARLPLLTSTSLMPSPLPLPPATTSTNHFVRFPDAHTQHSRSTSILQFQSLPHAPRLLQRRLWRERDVSIILKLWGDHQAHAADTTLRSDSTPHSIAHLEEAWGEQNHEQIEECARSHQRNRMAIAPRTRSSWRAQRTRCRWSSCTLGHQSALAPCKLSSQQKCEHDEVYSHLGVASLDRTLLLHLTLTLSLILLPLPLPGLSCQSQDQFAEGSQDQRP